MTAIWQALHLPVHVALHVVLPVVAALIGWRPRWVRAACILLAANLVDLDHLLATPLYDPTRVSIGFHPLHSYWAIGAYAIAAVLAPRRSAWRLLALGLLLHVAVDAVDALLLQPR